MSRTTIIRWKCSRCDAIEFSEPDKTPKGWLPLDAAGLELCDKCGVTFTAWVAGEKRITQQRKNNGRTRWTDDQLALLSRMWGDGETGQAIADAIGTYPAAVFRKAKDLRLPGRKPGPQSKYGDRKTASSGRHFPQGSRLRRHVTPRAKRSLRLADDHPAVIEKRTVFPTTVVEVADSPRVLVGGINQRKIGKMVIKGAWKGMPIYCLTLEERATCPSSCVVWNDCYGNNMHHARRHRHGPALEVALNSELETLQAQHPAGFVVRLHILGDFYSVDYVRQWREWIERLPALRVFGFTAHRIDTPIGEAVINLNRAGGSRCRIRYSDGPGGGGLGAVVVDSDTAVPGQVLCPAQTEATDCCGSCGLCWTMNKVVAFQRH